MATERAANDPNAGFSLVTVLWILVAIAAVLTPLTIRARTQVLHTASLLQIDRLDLLARGMANVLAVRQAEGGTEPANSVMYACTAGSLEIRYLLQSHAALVSLNHAPKPALTAALAALGLDSAVSAAEAIITNRSYRQASSEQRTLSIRGGPKQAPFESISELYEIENLKGVPYRLLHRTFTAHSTSNALSAPDLPAHLQRAVEANEDLQAGPATHFDQLTISVDIRRGSVRGQFNGVFIRGVNHVVESWRYDDLPENLAEITDPCSSHFAREIARDLEEFV